MATAGASGICLYLIIHGIGLHPSVQGLYGSALLHPFTLGILLLSTLMILSGIAASSLSLPVKWMACIVIVASALFLHALPYATTYGSYVHNPTTNSMTFVPGANYVVNYYVYEIGLGMPGAMLLVIYRIAGGSKVFQPLRKKSQ